MISDILGMKASLFQFVLAGCASLVAVFWMRSILLYTIVICLMLICSWLCGLLLYLRCSQDPAAANVLASVCNNKHTLLCSHEVGHHSCCYCYFYMIHKTNSVI